MTDLQPDRSEQREKSGPLAGIRVLDLSRILAGPYCTQLLGDYGADIIKVERPDGGDDTRSWGPPYVIGADGQPTEESAYYLSANRNKRSIALDISTAEGADTVRRLLLNCDVVIENFKTGGLEKYGLDYPSLSKIKPDVVYCSISGYGQDGPNAERAGYDLIAQAYGGIMSLTGESDGEPMKVGVGIADVMCGMYATTAILAALRHRDQTGEGQHIDLALVDSQVAWLINEGTNYLTSGKPPIRRGNQHPNIVPYQVFETRDGHIIVAAGNDSQFARFCEILGAPELAEDDRYRTNQARLANRESLIELLTPLIQQHAKLSLIAEMDAKKVPGSVINTVPEVFASDQVTARGMRISMPFPNSKSGEIELIGNPVKFSKTPVTYRHAPPRCGEHTQAVIEELLNDQSADTGNRGKQS